VNWAWSGGGIGKKRLNFAAGSVMKAVDLMWSVRLMEFELELEWDL
jgi:hypothetical protein